MTELKIGYHTGTLTLSFNPYFPGLPHLRAHCNQSRLQALSFQQEAGRPLNLQEMQTEGKDSFYVKI